MRDQKLDTYHDLAIENNDFAVIDGRGEMLQALRISLLTVKYEYWLDGTLGIPWNNGMFQPWMSQSEKELHVKKSALGVEGVTSVKELVYSHDRVNRSDLIEIEVDSIEGLIGSVSV